MAGSNWESFAIDMNGAELLNAEFESGGVTFEVYKNSINVLDALAWREGGSFVSPIVMKIESGSLEYNRVYVAAWRGPQQGVYAAIWTLGDDLRIDKGILCCGVYGFADDGSWLGVSKEARECLFKQGREREAPEELLSRYETYLGEQEREQEREQEPKAAKPPPSFKGEF